MNDNYYSKLNKLFDDIVIIKIMVVNLSTEQLRAFKHCFYSQNILTWQLDVMWEYIWGDLTYGQIKRILGRFLCDKK